MDGVGTVYGGGKVKKDGVGVNDGHMPYVRLSGKCWGLSYSVDGNHFPILHRYWGGNLLYETTGRE